MSRVISEISEKTGKLEYDEYLFRALLPNRRLCTNKVSGGLDYIY